jgi:hypothetical protein
MEGYGARMGLMDTIKGWFGGAKSSAAGQADNLKAGVEKAGDAVDDKTGNKFQDKVDTAQDAADKGIDKITGGDGS